MPEDRTISDSPRDANVTEGFGAFGQSSKERFDRIRAEVEESFRAAQERVARRTSPGPGAMPGSSKHRARDLLEASRRHVRELLRVKPLEKTAGGHAPEEDGQRALALGDMHMVERLLSYVRHSVVRVCFYNLKLFCPSLVDEYDAHVRDEVLANMEQLDAARAELEAFFGQALSSRESVGAAFPEARSSALRHLDALVELSRAARGRLDDEAVRRSFAERAPGLIDGVMDLLQAVQTELDSHKIALAEVVEQAVALSRKMAEEKGLNIVLSAQPASRILGERIKLLNCFTELITNAAKYSGGTQLDVSVAPVNPGGQWIGVSFRDNGRGMTPDEAAACLTRGASRGGTGEGLPMVVHIVEGEHLGEFEIAGEPGRGCRAVVRLPVKLEATRQGKDGQSGDERDPGDRR